MDISDLSQWLWPILSLLLAVLWLWTLLRRHGTPRVTRPAVPAQPQTPVEAEDALRAAYMLQVGGSAWGREELARSVGRSEAMAERVAGALTASGWAEQDPKGGIRLTEAGVAHAQELIRAHRLWERYLADQQGMRLDEVHAEAHRREHETTPEELKKLDTELGHPAWDPHGHPIPGPGRQVVSSPGRPLLEEGTLGSRLRIVCLDDEPAALLAQLIALGLKPGVDVQVTERDTDMVRLQVEGNTIPLALAAARHVSVVPSPALPVPLGELRVGTQALVVEIGGHGKHQRRMLDMGFVPGAAVTVIRRAPLGDPIEYRVKDTAVALRQKDANTVLVGEMTDG